MEDFSEELDKIPEGEAVKDISDLAHKFTMLVLDEALNRRINPVRMKNRELSPMALGTYLARQVQVLLTSNYDTTKEEKSP